MGKDDENVVTSGGRGGRTISKDKGNIVEINSAVLHRRDVWEIAKDLVSTIIETHGLELYRTGSPFIPSATYTTVEQHLDHIERVATWLLEKE